jgi:hypothetical protein
MPKYLQKDFLNFDEKWYFWLKVHYDLYIRFPGSYTAHLNYFNKINQMVLVSYF